MRDDTSAPLPRNPHPIASAFFASHDNELRNESASMNSSNIARLRNSLGWRTRYASAAWYPVSILPVAIRRAKSDGGSKRLGCNEDYDHQDVICNEAVLFHVRQIFPGNWGTAGLCGNDEKINRKYETGNTVWPGSIVLLKYLEKLAHSHVIDHGSRVHHKTPDVNQGNPFLGKVVADLGSGTSITTLTSALLGADCVFCTDGDDHVVALASSNVKNAILELDQTPHLLEPCDEIQDNIQKCHFDVRGCKVVVQKYLWGDGTLAKELSGNGIDPKYFDIILCADCIVPKLYPIEPLVNAIDELSCDATITYLSYERRHFSEYDPAVEFRRLAHLRNLLVEVIPDQDLNQMFCADDIEIWKVQRLTKRSD